MHPEIDAFAHLRSPVHVWDPRWKLVSLFGFIVLAAVDRPGEGAGAAPLASWLAPQLALAGVAVALLGATRIPFRFVARRLRGVVWFILAVVLALCWRWEPGEGLRWSTAGFLHGLAVALRALAIVTVAVAAFATARFDVTLKALGALRLPGVLVQVIQFSYRYLFVYLDQLRRIGIALRARGFRPGPNTHTLRTCGHSIGVLLLGSVERTSRIRGAMLCRGFDGTLRVTSELRTRLRDVLLSLFVLGTGVALLAWRLA